MFDVQQSGADRIVVRDHEDGHLWVFVVEHDTEPSLAVSAIVSNPAAQRSPYEHAMQAQIYA